MRRLRLAAGMRQQDLAQALGGVLARSSLANVEAGRELPSERLWTAISTQLPAWSERLRPAYEAARAPCASPPGFRSGGPFVIEDFRLTYVFREHRAPEEIVMARRVRATSPGADRYGLQLAASPDFDIDYEPLWGGTIQRHEHRTGQHTDVHLADFVFDAPLGRGDHHDFAVRGWVRHSTPETAVIVHFTQPVQHVALEAHFYAETPQAAWSFAGVLDQDLIPEREPTPDCLRLPSVDGRVAATFAPIELNLWYGIAWSWEEAR